MFAKLHVVEYLSSLDKQQASHFHLQRLERDAILRDQVFSGLDESRLQSLSAFIGGIFQIPYRDLWCDVRIILFDEDATKWPKRAKNMLS